MPRQSLEVPLPLVAYDVFRVTDPDGGDVPTRSDAGQLVASPGMAVGEVTISRRLPPVVMLGMGISVVSLIVVGVGAVRGRGKPTPLAEGGLIS